MSLVRNLLAQFGTFNQFQIDLFSSVKRAHTIFYWIAKFRAKHLDVSFFFFFEHAYKKYVAFTANAIISELTNVYICSEMNNKIQHSRVSWRLLQSNVLSSFVGLWGFAFATNKDFRFGIVAYIKQTVVHWFCLLLAVSRRQNICSLFVQVHLCGWE